MQSLLNLVLEEVGKPMCLRFLANQADTKNLLSGELSHHLKAALNTENGESTFVLIDRKAVRGKVCLDYNHFLYTSDSKQKGVHDGSLIPL